MARPGDVKLKDPDSILDYVVDWSEWLGSDTVSSSTFTVGTGLTKDSESNTTTTATVWVSGGTANSSYTVTNRIVTAGGRTADRSFVVKVVER